MPTSKRRGRQRPGRSRGSGKATRMLRQKRRLARTAAANLARQEVGDGSNKIAAAKTKAGTAPPSKKEIIVGGDGERNLKKKKKSNAR